MAGDLGLQNYDPFKPTYYINGRKVQDRERQNAGSVKTQEGETSAAETSPPCETFEERYRRAVGSGKSEDHEHQIESALGNADPTLKRYYSDQEVEEGWKDMSRSIHCFIAFQLPGRYVDSKSLAPETREEVRGWGPNVGELLGDPGQAQFVFVARVWRTLDEQLFGADLKTHWDPSGPWAKYFEMRDLFKSK